MSTTTIEAVATGEVCTACGDEIYIESVEADELSLGCGCSCASALC